MIEPRPPPARPRSLWPREHGAYAQLAVPLITAFVLRIQTPNLAMVALAAAACLAFLANEPLLVVLGHRGPRMRDRDAGRARLRLAIVSSAGLAAGGAGLVLGARDTAIAAAIAGVPALAVIALAWRGAERTIAAEAVAAAALTGASTPVLVAGGAGLGAAIAIWIAWTVGFGSTVVAVHRVIARHKRPASSLDRVLGLGFIATAIACAVLAARGSILGMATPLAAVAAVLVITPPAATRLRAVGVASVAAALGSTAIAVSISAS